ncbi:hypothetical protein [Streptomyces mirabilis]|uniref:hypothetical protein n=1 Tax=Streptomyces mirabilis TaxID=68239 RepID=UPI00332B4C49
MRKVTMRAIQGAVAAGLALGGVAVATGTAAAGVGVNTDHWQVEHNYWIGPNDNTNRCVDDSIDPNSKDGNLLRGFPCYQNSYSGGWQKWRRTAGSSDAAAQADHRGRHSRDRGRTRRVARSTLPTQQRRLVRWFAVSAMKQGTTGVSVNTNNRLITAQPNLKEHHYR